MRKTTHAHQQQQHPGRRRRLPRRGEPPVLPLSHLANNGVTPCTLYIPTCGSRSVTPRTQSWSYLTDSFPSSFVTQPSWCSRAVNFTCAFFPLDCTRRRLLRGHLKSWSTYLSFRPILRSRVLAYITVKLKKKKMIVLIHHAVLKCQLKIYR